MGDGDVVVVAAVADDGIVVAAAAGDGIVVAVVVAAFVAAAVVEGDVVAVVVNGEQSATGGNWIRYFQRVPWNQSVSIANRRLDPSSDPQQLTSSSTGRLLPATLRPRLYRAPCLSRDQSPPVLRC